MIINYKGITPSISENVYIAPGVSVIGKVEIGKYSSIWFNSVLRGDIDSITIGERTNIQDLTVIHPNPGAPVTIEDDVTVGHSCVLHGCTIKKGSLIGLGSMILNNSEIGENCFVGAGSLIPEGKIFPPNSLIFGSPAKVVRELTAEEIENFHVNSTQLYASLGQEFLQNDNGELKR